MAPVARSSINQVPQPFMEGDYFIYWPVLIQSDDLHYVDPELGVRFVSKILSRLLETWLE